MAKRPGTQAIFNQEMAKYDVSVGAFAVGIGMAGPTLIAHGSEEQKRRQLPPMLRGESRLVSAVLRTRCRIGSRGGSRPAPSATADPASSNGQKVWTSGAQHSDWAILIARTNPDVPKHKGITYFLVDMHSPGIEVRPLRQITGTAHFNEVFLTDVVIPATDVVGEINGGWAVAHTTMSYRQAPSSAVSDKVSRSPRYWTWLAVVAAGADPLMRRQIAHFYTRVELLRFMKFSSADGTFPGSSA